MASRLCFCENNKKVTLEMIDFEWFFGFSLVQKQKSIKSLHDAIRRRYPAANPLEISTKSKDDLGRRLSAFNLRLDGVALENIFQAAKVFERGGPFTDLLMVKPKDAKHDERFHSSGALIAF